MARLPVIASFTLVYYGRPRELEYDFVVAPGADPGRIALAFEGVERLAVDTVGDLVLHTAAGELRQPRPVVYQEIEGARRPVTGDYVLDGDGHRTEKCPDVWAAGTDDGFVAKVSTDGGSLLYSTFLCGTGHDVPTGIGLDAAGNVYVAGSTGPNDFPTINPLQGTSLAFPWGLTAFVSKLSPDGSQLLYSTYLGGSTTAARPARRLWSRPEEEDEKPQAARQFTTYTRRSRP